jgi:exopolysaccharide production protein ExoZ
MSKIPADPRAAAVFLAESMLLLPGVLHIQPLMEVAWTLSFIMLFYFIAGGIAGMFRVSALSRLSRFLLLAGAAFLWAAVGESTGWWPRRTNIFFIGMALYEAIEGMRREKMGSATRLTTAAMAVVLLGVCLRTCLMLYLPQTGRVPLLLLRNIITSVTLFAFVWVAYFGPEWWKRLLSGTHLRKLGAASYSFYLTHGFAVKAFRYGIIPWLGAAAGTPLVFSACQLIGLALSIAIARGVYTYVESPLSLVVPRMRSVKAVSLAGKLASRWSMTAPSNLPATRLMTRERLSE